MPPTSAKKPLGMSQAMNTKTDLADMQSRFNVLGELLHCRTSCKTSAYAPSSLATVQPRLTVLSQRVTAKLTTRSHRTRSV